MPINHDLDVTGDDREHTESRALATAPDQLNETSFDKCLLSS